MKIKVNLEPNTNFDTHTFDIEDLGITESEWLAMSESEQKELLQNEINRLPEQPYWMLDNFETD